MALRDRITEQRPDCFSAEDFRFCFFATVRDSMFTAVFAPEDFLRQGAPLKKTVSWPCRIQVQKRPTLTLAAVHRSLGRGLLRAESPRSGVLRNARNARLGGRWHNGKDAPGVVVPRLRRRGQDDRAKFEGLHGRQCAYLRANPERIYAPRRVSTTFQSCQSRVLGRSHPDEADWAQPWRGRRCVNWDQLYHKKKRGRSVEWVRRMGMHLDRERTPTYIS
jgi:hypothetical protein